MPLAAADFELVGAYEGFPVYKRRRGWEDIIYLPGVEGWVAPYERARAAP